MSAQIHRRRGALDVVDGIAETRTRARRGSRLPTKAPRTRAGRPRSDPAGPCRQRPRCWPARPAPPRRRPPLHPGHRGRLRRARARRGDAAPRSSRSGSRSTPRVVRTSWTFSDRPVATQLLFRVYPVSKRNLLDRIHEGADVPPRTTCRRPRPPPRVRRVTGNCPFARRRRDPRERHPPRATCSPRTTFKAFAARASRTAEGRYLPKLPRPRRLPPRTRTLADAWGCVARRLTRA